MEGKKFHQTDMKKINQIPNRGLNVPLSERPVLLCLGYSFTYGDGVPFEHSWPSILQGKFLKYQVLNAGVKGASISTMLDVFDHYSPRAEIAYVILTILDIDMIRMGGHLRDDDFFLSESNYQSVLSRSSKKLEEILTKCVAAELPISVVLWARDIFITRFQLLSKTIGEICKKHGVPFRSDIHSYLNTISFGRFIVSERNSHPGKLANKLVSEWMHNALPEDLRNERL